MAMPITWPRQGEWTVEALWELLPDDGNRYEVIDGVLFVTPAPRLTHQRALEHLAQRLFGFVEARVAGIPLRAPADIVFGPKRAVQPDLFVAPLVHGRPPKTWQEITHLLLAVEVPSPGTATRDRGVKRRLYQQHADEYWIVDLDARVIERWRPGDERPEILATTLDWRPAGADASLTLDLSAFFGDVLDT
jgi:Uma2 family endonuclease